MNELQKVFNYGESQLRTVVQGEDIWFVASDVCDVLEIRNSRDAVSRLKANQKASVGISDGRQLRHKTVINEAGVYKLVFRSNKPEAEKFSDWVADEVLPSIRKHGGYLTPEKIQEALLNPDTLIQLATNLKEEQQKRMAAEKTIEEQKPRVLFAQSVETSQSSILVGELAKILKQNGVEIGQNRLFEWLREKGYLIRKRGEEFNNPTQRSMELGLFEITKRTINNPDGSVRITRTPKVTGKGQIYFINKFLAKAN